MLRTGWMRTSPVLTAAITCAGRTRRGSARRAGWTSVGMTSLAVGSFGMGLAMWAVVAAYPDVASGRHFGAAIGFVILGLMICIAILAIILIFSLLEYLRKLAARAAEPLLARW